MPNDAQTRMNAAALADRLFMADGDGFSADDAAALLALLPKPGLWRRLLAFVPAIRAQGTVPGLGMSGAAAGLGHVQMDGDAKKFDFDTHGRQCLRAGQWRLYRDGAVLRPWVDVLRAEQVMGDERQAEIRFRRGVPVQMCLWQAHEWHMGPVTFSLLQRSPWKEPAP